MTSTGMRLLMVCFDRTERVAQYELTFRDFGDNWSAYCECLIGI